MRSLSAAEATRGAPTSPPHKESGHNNLGGASASHASAFAGSQPAADMPGSGDMDAAESQAGGPGNLVSQLRDAALGLCSSLRAHQEKRRERLQTLRAQSAVSLGHRGGVPTRGPSSRAAQHSAATQSSRGPRTLFCSITMAAAPGA